ncbi:LacI family transcriptional regulator [Sediminihabitans luteus]|uniref:LacI family transcriptional regulator n=1 Tax=Sediminihabitans luteus TaxID=1138585 RepID=A0A2M9D015_9CELL|nr:DUF6807 family protein [Sediminihabitans luteus]PJJ77415.1 LacI family transcriptional regulator [Sediminihabitans luteus]GII98308.1 transcriptional regulator [Sediminihabitans luteus]
MSKVIKDRPVATISDVATAAGVSRATVSRVMNGRATVDPEITERVRAAASELRYRPSNVARSLSLGRTDTVALVVPDLANPMFQQILRGTTTAASAVGYRVLVADTAENPRDEAAIALEARLRCDALVLVSPRMTDAELAELAPQVAPVVLVNRTSAVAPSVLVDYRAGAAAVLRHLIGLGHRRVVYLAGPPSSASDAMRRDGIDDVLREQSDLKILEIPGGSTVGAGHGAVEDVLATRATAVVAFNDIVAFGLLAGLNEAGVAVPGDLTVTGFDDIELARYATPSLTTVAVPQHELGRHAWQELHAVIDPHRTPSPVTSFTPRLEVRASSGPVPRAVGEPSLAPTSAGTSTAGTSTADAATAGTSTATTSTATTTPRPDGAAAFPGPSGLPGSSGLPSGVAPDATDAFRWSPDGEAEQLVHDGVRLARYEKGDRLPPVHSRRPYLHPVHTLGGVPLTDAGPVDHRHHYGVSMAVPDVNGTSHWGGRTYVQDVGPTLLQNHGKQVSGGVRVDATDPHVLHDAVRWFDESGVPQLDEDRTLTARTLDDGWALTWRSVLRADHGALVIGSPATNGRRGAGYGGLFWRLSTAPAHVLSAAGEGEGATHGSASPWVAFVQDRPTGPTTLLTVQHGEPRHWFLRADEYPGACPALAWETPLTIPAGGTFETTTTTLLLDRAVDAAEAADLAGRLR